MRQPLPAKFAASRNPIPSSRNEGPIRIGKTAGQRDLAIFEPGPILIARPIERSQNRARKPAGFLEHGIDDIGTQIGKRRIAIKTG